MNKMKITIIAAYILTTAASVSAQNANDIMDKHIAAIGGDNWNKLKTLKMEGSMSQQGMDISYTQTIVFGKAMRTDISAMGMNGWMITTTKDGWMYMPFMGGSKIDTMKPEMVKMQQKQMDVRGHQMIDYKTDGSKLEYAGLDTINANACYKVKITDKDGHASTSYIDCKTYYLLRTETKATVKDEEQEIAVSYSDYKKLDEGIVMPMQVNAMGQDITYKSIQVNKPVDESIFIPKSDKADAGGSGSKN